MSSRAERQESVLVDLYASYASLHGHLEEDHLVYGVEGGGLPRTRLQLDTLRPFVRGRSRGRFLDVGCNKGLMLRAFAREHAGWEVHGYEISPHHYDVLGDVLEPRRFHTGPLEDLEGGFDVITVLHTLEHVPEPTAFLHLLGERLTPTGILMLQVPDLAQAPGDLVVYDHLSHFVTATLTALVERSGLGVALVSDCATPRELALLACRGGSVAPCLRAPHVASLDVARRAVSFLGDLQRIVEGTRGQLVGVFGTGLVGSWVGGLLGDRLAFFVDESPLKIGSEHLGRPVVHPGQVPEGSDVILAVSPSLAATLGARWRSPLLRFLAPAAAAGEA